MFTDLHSLNDHPETGDDKPDKRSFLRKYYWGLICWILFFGGSGYLVLNINEIKPSSAFRHNNFCAKYSPGAALTIANPPDNFTIVVSGGRDIDIKQGKNMDEEDSTYHVDQAENSLTIHSLDPRITGDENWEKLRGNIDVGPSVTRLPDGSFYVELVYDSGPVVWTGVYKVKDRTIIEHHLKTTNIFSLMMHVIFVPLLYVAGLVVRALVHFAIRGVKKIKA